MKKNTLLFGCLCALGSETIYGFSYLFTKTATEHASALALLGWRFLVAFVVMGLCALLGLIKIDLRGKNLKPLLLVVIFSPAIYYIGETVGISSTTASESSVCLACIPVVSLAASALILRKKPTKLQLAGILITLAGGLITIFAVGGSSSFSAIGYTFLLIAVISYALYSVFVERASDFTGAEVTFSMVAVGALVYVLLALIEALTKGTVTELATLPVRDMGFLSAILYQGIGCSVLAFFLSNVAIAKIGVNRVSSFIGVSTVVAVIAGVLFLRESLSVYQIIGGIIIIAGVYTANASDIMKHKKSGT